LTDDALWIIGLYLAEGSSSDRVLQFSLHGDEAEYQARVIDYFQNELGIRVAYAPKREGWNGVQLLIRNATLARFFSHWLGRGAANKAIPAELINLPLERLRHIVQGILDGDGCERFATFSQSSPMLALQVTEFMLRDGHDPSISKFTRSNPDHSDTYTITHKEKRVHQNKRGFWHLLNERLVRTQVTYDQYQGLVYNLEVEGDHTYIVQNIVVHNCFERELAAGRDAAGYGHVPLGQFQWGMWDLKRSGQGTHSDHSALKVLNPTPHDAVDWAAKMSMPRGESWQKIAPDWWRNTQPFRDAVADDWDKNIAPYTPQNQIPYGASDPTYQYTSSTKLAESLRSPWFTHPETGLHTIGTPGHTIMQHATRSLGLNTPEVWDALKDSEDGTENAGKS
jgi:hypothetical protein